MTTVLKVGGDGAGTIDHRMVFTPKAIAQLKQLAMFAQGRGGNQPFDPLSEQQARDLATVIGEGGTYVSAKPQRIAAVELRATLREGQTAGARAVIAVLPQDSEPYRVLTFTPVHIASLR